MIYMMITRKRNKNLVYLLLLLVLVSLAAHLLADLQHTDNGSQTRVDSYLLHTAFLIPVMGMVLLSPGAIRLGYRKADPRPPFAPLLFRPPIF
jgi:hypothetical protein